MERGSRDSSRMSLEGSGKVGVTLLQPSFVALQSGAFAPVAECLVTVWSPITALGFRV
jgi:hypothetical protein